MEMGDYVATVRWSFGSWDDAGRWSSQEFVCRSEGKSLLNFGGLL